MAPWSEIVLILAPLDCLNVFLVPYVNCFSLLRLLHIITNAFTIVTFLVHAIPRYEYVQIVYFSFFLEFFFLISFLNNIPNILLIFNYSSNVSESLAAKAQHEGYICPFLHMSWSSPITPPWTKFIWKFCSKKYVNSFS